jgi:copper chaperone CopZ
MKKNQLIKKILILALIIIPTVSLTTLMLMNKDKIGVSKHQKEITLVINGMFGEHCPKTIEEAFAPIEGVKSVQVNYDTKKALIVYDSSKLNEEDLKSVVKKAGYIASDENKLQVLEYNIRFN